MTAYPLDVRGWKPMVAAVAGARTDLGAPCRQWLPHYLLWACLPLPSRAVTALFCAASVVHFAEETVLLARAAAWESALVHAAVAAVGARFGTGPAFKAMLAYLTLRHTPQHYARQWRGGQRRRRVRGRACNGGRVGSSPAAARPAGAERRGAADRHRPHLRGRGAERMGWGNGCHPTRYQTCTERSLRSLRSLRSIS